MIKVNFEKNGIDKKEIMKYKEEVENIHKDLHKRAEDEEDISDYQSFLYVLAVSQGTGTGIVKKE